MYGQTKASASLSTVLAHGGRTWHRENTWPALDTLEVHRSFGFSTPEVHGNHSYKSCGCVAVVLVTNPVDVHVAMGLL